jgi:hypothetical protein
MAGELDTHVAASKNRLFSGTLPYAWLHAVCIVEGRHPSRSQRHELATLPSALRAPRAGQGG